MKRGAVIAAVKFALAALAVAAGVVAVPVVRVAVVPAGSGPFAFDRDIHLRV